MLHPPQRLLNSLSPPPPPVLWNWGKVGGRSSIDALLGSFQHLRVPPRQCCFSFHFLCKTSTTPCRLVGMVPVLVPYVPVLPVCSHGQLSEISTPGRRSCCNSRNGGMRPLFWFFFWMKYSVALSCCAYRPADLPPQYVADYRWRFGREIGIGWRCAREELGLSCKKHRLAYCSRQVAPTRGALNFFCMPCGLIYGTIGAGVKNVRRGVKNTTAGG